MLETIQSLRVDEVLDEYLGYEIRGATEGLVRAVPKFASDGAPVLRAVSVPLARKLIWQWWNCLEPARIEQA